MTNSGLSGGRVEVEAGSRCTLAPMDQSRQLRRSADSVAMAGATPVRWPRLITSTLRRGGSCRIPDEVLGGLDTTAMRRRSTGCRHTAAELAVTQDSSRISFGGASINRPE